MVVFAMLVSLFVVLCFMLSGWRSEDLGWGGWL